MQETARRKVLLQRGQDVLQRLLLQVTRGAASLSDRLGFYLRKPVKSTLAISEVLSKYLGVNSGSITICFLD